MEKEMAEKIKETLDCALKISAILMPTVLLNPKEANAIGLTMDKILYLNKNYYEIREYLEEILGE